MKPAAQAPKPAAKPVEPRIRYSEFVHGLDGLHKSVLRGYFLRSPKDSSNTARTRSEWQKLLNAELKRPIK